ncbi:MAG: class I SAM-dependent methyltransferase [Phycisphaerae bacterium]|nr:class I SAM-dependent methyltransferase [Phycisphaerae bacterium]
MANQYDKKYAQKTYYWGKRPSSFCLKVLELLPPDQPRKLIDIGCGEGRQAVFFARNGYEVTAFDLSPQGVDKTCKLADEAGVSVRAFEADMREYRLTETFDIVFCHGGVHYIPEKLRTAVLDNYKQFTTKGGLNVLSTFVKKPFIAKAPDAQSTAHKWVSGELFMHYHNWRLEFCTETIFDCMSSGVPHQHTMDLMIARKV